MNQDELREYLRAHRLRDEWWVSVDGTIEEHTVKIPTLMTRKKRYRGKTVHVLHVSLEDAEDEEWIPLEYLESGPGPRLKLHGHCKKASKRDSNANQKEAEDSVNHLESLTAEVIEIRRAMNQWQCMMSEMMQKVNTLNDAVHTNMCTLNDAERSVALDAKESELAIRERELERRESYISKCENKLIDMTYQQEETATELELLSEGKRIPD